MKTAIAAVLLALLLVCVGCASPQDTTEEREPDESPSATDNDFGAEPVNPSNASNETDGPGTVSQPDNATGDETGEGTSTNGTGTTETNATNGEASAATSELVDVAHAVATVVGPRTPH